MEKRLLDQMHGIGTYHTVIMLCVQTTIQDIHKFILQTWKVGVAGVELVGIGINSNNVFISKGE